MTKIKTSNYGLRLEPCEVQGCHEPYVVHGGMRSEKEKNKEQDGRWGDGEIKNRETRRSGHQDIRRPGDKGKLIASK